MWVFKTGFQWTKWILNCDTCTRPFIAQELWSWIFPPPENPVMINRNKGYGESPIRNTWIGSDGNSDCGVVLFQSILLTEQFKKKNKKKQESYTLPSFLAILLVAHSLDVWGKVTLSVYIIRVMFI